MPARSRLRRALSLSQARLAQELRGPAPSRHSSRDNRQQAESQYAQRAWLRHGLRVEQTGLALGYQGGERSGRVGVEVEILVLARISAVVCVLTLLIPPSLHTWVPPNWVQ